MNNYKELYLILWNIITDTIDMIDKQNYGMAKELLIKAQQEAEEKFIAAVDSEN